MQQWTKCVEYWYYALPTKKGGRHEAREEVMCEADNWKTVEVHRDARYRHLWVTGGQWPEGYKLVETRSTGYQHTIQRYYFHGPLGYMDSAYTRGHWKCAGGCEKCKVITQRLNEMYPDLDHRHKQLKRVPARGRWEFIEKLGVGAAHDKYRFGYYPKDTREEHAERLAMQLERLRMLGVDTSFL